jgi:hypothetical protein
MIEIWRSGRPEPRVSARDRCGILGYAAPVTSIEGLRVKALVAFWEVAPLCAGDTEFSFDDAYPFQQLFAAVAEVCGLKDKMAATGYELPDIAMVDDDSDDDSDDEGGAA